ncbi:MAG: prepilin-type N-terminal cleavage/methylation domain-containing protein [Pseudomonadota bacterium]
MQNYNLSTRKKDGFTLLELSIAIVIIGLVIGGVMVGKSLVNASEIRRKINDLNIITAAVNTFKTKYNCIPGDCNNTTSFLSNISGNGDGDGWIEWSSESIYATQSLYYAQLTPKNTTSVGSPYINANNDGFGYLYYQDLYTTYRRMGVTISWFGSGGFTNSNTCGQINTPALTPNDAMAIDTKIDDAVPNSGGFISLDGKIKQNPDCPAQATAPANCRNASSPNLYLNSDVIGCRTVYYLPGN